MAQYAVLIYAPDQGREPTGEERRQHDRHAEEMAASGSMLLAYALTPRDLATSVRAAGVVDGPYLETKEVVAGFSVLEAPDLDAAVALARTNPAVQQGGGVEIRPVEGGGVFGA